MKDTKFECMAHGWRNDHQVCPFCMILVLETDKKKLQVQVSVLKQQKEEAWTTTGLLSEQKRNDLLNDENERLRKNIEELEQNTCGSCSPDNYGWIFNRVEGRGACVCMTEAEPFQILLAALDKLARLGNGDRFGNSDGNRIALDALRAVLPLDYAE